MDAVWRWGILSHHPNNVEMTSLHQFVVVVVRTLRSWSCRYVSRLLRELPLLRSRHDRGMVDELCCEPASSSQLASWRRSILSARSYWSAGGCVASQHSRLRLASDSGSVALLCGAVMAVNSELNWMIRIIKRYTLNYTIHSWEGICCILYLSQTHCRMLRC